MKICVCGWRNCYTLLVGVKIGIVLYRTIFQYLSKFKIYVSFDLDIVLLGTHSKKNAKVDIQNYVAYDIRIFIIVFGMSEN